MTETNGHGKKGNSAETPAMGRPTYRTPDCKQRIITTLAIGLNLKTAAAYAGISYSTLASWRASDPDFLKATEEARAKAVISPTAKVVEVMRNEPLFEEDKNGTVKKDAAGKPVLKRDKRGKTVHRYSTAEQLAMVKWFLERRSDEFKLKTETKVEVGSLDDDAREIAKLIEDMDRNVLAADRRHVNGVSRN